MDQMDIDSPNQSININIAKERENSKNEYNEFKDYIIKNNIELQKELKESCKISQEFDQRLQANEILLDKYDTRINYMKGLLQNLNELRNDYSNIIEKSEEKVNLIREHNKKTKKIYYQIYLYLIITNIFTFITPFNLNYINSIFSVNIIYLILQIVYFILLPYIILQIKDKYFLIVNLAEDDTKMVKEITTKINKIKLEIKKTEDSCISLDNWINEI
tara:strand:- start:30 stop:683 length:654 start_codon:yes stop_codon:yes gene_type:complete